MVDARVGLSWLMPTFLASPWATPARRSPGRDRTRGRRAVRRGSTSWLSDSEASRGPAPDPRWCMSSPAEENVRGAKRGFDFLTRRRQPDHGGSHEDLLRLKNPYRRRGPPFRTPPRRRPCDTDAGRAGRRLRQGLAPSVRRTGRRCDANAITWRPCGTAVSAPISPAPPGWVPSRGHSHDRSDHPTRIRSHSAGLFCRPGRDS